jgi:hypothetical protein
MFSDNSVPRVLCVTLFRLFITQKIFADRQSEIVNLSNPLHIVQKGA